MAESRYVFVSSPVRELEDLRTALFDHRLPNGASLYVDELACPREEAEDPWADIDDLFRLIREAECVVVLLVSPRHGSPIRLNDREAHATFWEIELFYSVLIGKPVVVVADREFRPSPQLASLLKLLERALPRASWIKVNRSEVVSTVLKVMGSGRARRKASVRRFVEGLFFLRGRTDPGGRAEDSRLQFFLRRDGDYTVTPDHEVIVRGFGLVADQPSEELRLTRLWVVFRELLGRPYWEPGGEELLPEWGRFFQEWTAAASWYGLHSHAHLAVLPAATQLAVVRRRMKRLASSSWRHEPIHYPGGRLASARYSISHHMSRRPRRILLRAALADVERSLEEGREDRSGLIGIRGSIYRRLGEGNLAVRDYRMMLKLRQEAGRPDGEVGEALAELGYGYLRIGEFAKGRDLLQEAVKLIEGSDVRVGFEIRARRKLAVASLLRLDLRRARREFRTVRRLIGEHGVHDQGRWPWAI